MNGFSARENPPPPAGPARGGTKYFPSPRGFRTTTCSDRVSSISGHQPGRHGSPKIAWQWRRTADKSRWVRPLTSSGALSRSSSSYEPRVNRATDKCGFCTMRRARPRTTRLVVTLALCDKRKEEKSCGDTTAAAVSEHSPNQFEDLRLLALPLLHPLLHRRDYADRLVLGAVLRALLSRPCGSDERYNRSEKQRGARREFYCCRIS